MVHPWRLARALKSGRAPAAHIQAPATESKSGARLLQRMGRASQSIFQVFGRFKCGGDPGLRSKISAEGVGGGLAHHRPRPALAERLADQSLGGRRLCAGGCPGQMPSPEQKSWKAVVNHDLEGGCQCYASQVRLHGPHSVALRVWVRGRPDIPVQFGARGCDLSGDLWSLGSGPRYMICVTLFCTLRESENTRTCENCTRFKI